MTRTPSSAAERWSVRALLAFTVLAVLGYGIFALHPERIPTGILPTWFFASSFAWFARIHILLSGVALAIAFFNRVGTRWLVPFVAVFGISFLAEHIGTGTGFPFSGYAYTGLLGPRIGDRVPWVIPISWFLMSAPAWMLARASFPRAVVSRILFATGLLVLWDLALDPAMSYLTPYWVWQETGDYYGMPWVNLVGWFGTGLVLMAVLEWLDVKLDWAAGVSTAWALRYYLTVLFMPLGMLAAAGAWMAVGLTMGALTSAWMIHVFAVRSRSPASRAASPRSVAAGDAAGDMA